MGVEGDLDQLLARARFEEARRRELKLDVGDKPPAKRDNREVGRGREVLEETWKSEVVCFTCHQRLVLRWKQMSHWMVAW